MKLNDELTRRSAPSPNLRNYNCSDAHYIGARAPPATDIREFRICDFFESRFRLARLAALTYLSLSTHTYVRDPARSLFFLIHTPLGSLLPTPTAHTHSEANNT